THTLLRELEPESSASASSATSAYSVCRRACPDDVFYYSPIAPKSQAFFTKKYKKFCAAAFDEETLILQK
ncbi:hypothetical protein, partial [uncultured Gemmiger sp.]|uniref:hypothetical protein n=1 Tax=uncultured Gemmiger sp. TaxID=1623490 RepID=UPI0025F3F97A